MAGETETDLGKLDNMSELLMSGDKLRKLALLMHLQEAQSMRTIKFRSVHHQIQSLRDSRKTYESTIAILDEAEQLKGKLPLKRKRDLQQDDKVFFYVP